MHRCLCDLHRCHWRAIGNPPDAGHGYHSRNQGKADVSIRQCVDVSARSNWGVRVGCDREANRVVVSGAT